MPHFIALANCDWQGRISFWDESDIEEIQTGPFPVGTRIRVTSLTNDPMGIAGKVGAIAWIIPGGASVKLDDREEKVKVQDACMTRELGISMKVVDANGEELQIRGGIDAFEPDKFREVINIQMSCKRNESPSELQEQCRNLLTKWTELVPTAGVKNNPTCTVSVDHLELDGQSLSSRDPFKWASNDSQLAG